MKNYFKGFLVLASVIMMLVFLIIKTHGYLCYSREVLMELNTTKENNKSSYELMKRNLLASSSINQGIDTFLDKWKVFLKKGMDHNKVLNDIVELSFFHTVAIVEKQSQQEVVKEKGVFKESISLISLKAVGTFERIYGWLGAVEEAYPHIRISDIELVSENMNVAAILRLQIPKMI